MIDIMKWLVHIVSIFGAMCLLLLLVYVSSSRASSDHPLVLNDDMYEQIHERREEFQEQLRIQELRDREAELVEYEFVNEGEDIDSDTEEV